MPPSARMYPPASATRSEHVRHRVEVRRPVHVEQLGKVQPYLASLVAHVEEQVVSARDVGARSIVGVWTVATGHGQTALGFVEVVKVVRGIDSMVDTATCNHRRRPPCHHTAGLSLGHYVDPYHAGEPNAKQTFLLICSGPAVTCKRAT